jgi:hypothetical protein
LQQLQQLTRLGKQEKIYYRKFYLARLMPAPASSLLASAAARPWGVSGLALLLLCLLGSGAVVAAVIGVEFTHFSRGNNGWQAGSSAASSWGSAG